MDKIKNLCDPIFVEENLNLIKKVLKNNNYPMKFNDKHVNLKINNNSKKNGAHRKKMVPTML